MYKLNLYKCLISVLEILKMKYKIDKESISFNFGGNNLIDITSTIFNAKIS